MTLTQCKVKVTGLLNFRKLAKPCMLAVMAAAPVAGLSGYVIRPIDFDFNLYLLNMHEAAKTYRTYTCTIKI